MNDKEFMEQKAGEMTISELVKAIKIKIDKSMVVSPKEEWIDITKECEFRLVQDDKTCGGYNYFEVYHHKINLGYMINDALGQRCKDVGLLYLINDYKLERSEWCNHFKILKRRE